MWGKYLGKLVYFLDSANSVVFCRPFPAMLHGVQADLRILADKRMQLV